MIDATSSTMHGTVAGHPFSCTVDGTLFIDRVSDFVRDEARLAAAGEFLHAGRALTLTYPQRQYWSAVRLVSEWGG